MHRLRRTAVVAVLVAVGALALAACGSSSSSSKDDDAAAVLKQTFGAAKTLKSGKLALHIGYRDAAGKTTSIALTGPFQSNGPGALPNFDFTLAIGSAGQTFDAGVTSVGGKGYITVAGTSYVMNANDYARFKSGYESSQRKTGAAQRSAPTLAKLGVDPLRWLANPKVVGTTTVDNTKTIHVTAAVKVPVLVTDLSRLLGRASSSGLPGTGGSSVPKKLTPAQIKTAEDSVSGLSVNVYTGENDKTLRRMTIGADVDLPQGSSIAGVSKGHLTVDLSFSDLNQPQTITAPESPQPFSELRKQLQTLLTGAAASAAGGSGSGSGTGGGGGAATDANSKYLKCLQKAGSNLDQVQQCAALVGQ